LRKGNRDPFLRELTIDFICCGANVEAQTLCRTSSDGALTNAKVFE